MAERKKSLAAKRLAAKRLAARRASKTCPFGFRKGSAKCIKHPRS